MIHYIMRQWNSKKGSIFLIILGFFIGSLVLSIGTSITVENYKYIYDQTSGNPEEQVDIIMKGEKGLPKSEFTKLLLTFVKYGEVQLLNMSKVRLDDYSQEYYFVPILFQEQPKWHIPLIKGRYFEKEDTVTKEKKVIVGKKIAERNGIKEKDSIKINKEQYTVIGICGRDIRETQWDEVIYVYYDEFFENNEFYLASEGELTSILKEGKQQFMENKDIILAKAENSGIQLTFKENNEKVSFSTVKNSMIITLVSAIIIFTIAIINIINLMIYWISQRKREFGIMKALGANNSYIVKWVIIEVISMAVISAFLAIIVQLVILMGFKDILLGNQIYLSISVINCIVAIVVATMCGLIAAVVPAKRAIKVQPVEVVKYE